MRRAVRTAASCACDSSGNPYTQPGAVRCAVEVSSTKVSASPSRATASRAAASGRHRNTASAAAIASARRAGSLRSASGRVSRDMSARSVRRAAKRSPVVPELPSMNTFFIAYFLPHS